MLTRQTAPIAESAARKYLEEPGTAARPLKIVELTILVIFCTTGGEVPKLTVQTVSEPRTARVAAKSHTV